MLISLIEFHAHCRMLSSISLVYRFGKFHVVFDPTECYLSKSANIHRVQYVRAPLFVELIWQRTTIECVRVQRSI